mmetsp:Transcript_5836/g.10331  ORF Transcript_5836/g.10331 Transcript_5836/m.10331 type:complete len:194 (-) Transcript_5836:1276-1857(-)
MDADDKTQLRVELSRRDFRMEINFLVSPMPSNVSHVRSAPEPLQTSNVRSDSDHGKQDSGRQSDGAGDQNIKEIPRPRKQPWTEQENRLLEDLVAQRGARGWKYLSTYFDDRTPGQLRSHWKHCLEIKESKRPFTPDEDAFILAEFDCVGTRWTEIARKMHRRCDIDIKNRFMHIRRKSAARQNTNYSPKSSQ